MQKIYDIAIIGAGPAGIATAVESVLCCINNIILFEKGQNHSETIRKYFDDRKPVDRDWKGLKVDLKGNIEFEDGTKNGTLETFNKSLLDHRIDTKFSTEIDEISKEGNHFHIKTNTNETFIAKYIVVAIGKMGKPNKPDYDLPKSLKDRINFNITDCPGHEDVLVVGGGDSAAEYAYLIRTDNKVTFTYRRDKITRANPKNTKNLLDSVKEGVIQLKLGVDILSVTDEEGKCRVNFSDNSSLVYDRIIYALGGSTPKEFLSKTPIVVDEKGKPVVDENHINSDGIYIAGDIAGPLGGSIALALNHGYNIVQDIIKKDNYCLKQ
ncbi:SidA/IucD/PvdA family monooxygenase [Sulfurimonas aquatica]|uniref:SidA/IucD/PvdA family monooxygenase n=1 Tax=Sulfurimonas aquatica TaxID=2672570 RepID=A0A975GCQ7_9BACT|nr:NAD(P)-binding domain-containing protein [Sulfurimonas aquatica]QSZ41529.1 SidA/IucD/PvdA family monooxygenase [Sulfurimonas aquatica]